MKEGISAPRDQLSNDSVSNAAHRQPFDDIMMCKFMIETQTDNIKALEKTINELKLENLQLIPLRYTIYKYKTQLEGFHSSTSQIQKEMVDLQLKNEQLVQRNQDLEVKQYELEKNKAELYANVTNLININKGKQFANI